jgi:hypothetical protein
MPLPELRGPNVTVLLHDGCGAGREVTIDYVRRLIAYGKSQGYTFMTMPDVNPGVADRVLDVKPTIWDKLTLNLVQLWFVWPGVLLRALFVICSHICSGYWIQQLRHCRNSTATSKGACLADDG